MNQAASVFSFRESIQITVPVEPIPKSLRHVRDQKGWKNANCKLSRAQLMDICKRFDAVGSRHHADDHLKWTDKVEKAGRETWEDIARDHGITRRHVWAIGTGRMWGHVTGRAPHRSI